MRYLLLICVDKDAQLSPEEQAEIGPATRHCADLDEAIEIASKHPSAWYGTIEVRPVAGEHCEDVG